MVSAYALATESPGTDLAYGTSGTFGASYALPGPRGIARYRSGLRTAGTLSAPPGHVTAAPSAAASITCSK
eukprot:2073487-Rhodomonas_salina.1